jgi:hypothetical protein
MLMSVLRAKAATIALLRAPSHNATVRTEGGATPGIYI